MESGDCDRISDQFEEEIKLRAGAERLSYLQDLASYIRSQTKPQDVSREFMEELVFELAVIVFSYGFTQAHLPDDPLLAEYQVQFQRAELHLRETERRDPGTAYGEWNLIEELGHGGFGQVFKAEHSRIPKHYRAIKIIPVRRFGFRAVAEQDWPVRFKQEVGSLLKVGDQPGFVRIYEFGKIGQSFYFTMDLVTGATTLNEYIEKRGKLPPPDAVRLILDLCHSLQVVHARQIAHRDLKPENILITEREGGISPQIVDFGIAHAFDEVTLPLDIPVADQQRQVAIHTYGMGSWPWFAPEQADPHSPNRSKPTVDIYSLGAIFVFLLTGTTPNDSTGFKTSLADLVKQNKLASNLSVVANRCLNSDPSERFQSATKLAEAMNASMKATRFEILAGISYVAAIGMVLGWILTFRQNAPQSLSEIFFTQEKNWTIQGPRSLMLALIYVILGLLNYQLIRFWFRCREKLDGHLWEDQQVFWQRSALLVIGTLALCCAFLPIRTFLSDSPVKHMYLFSSDPRDGVLCLLPFLPSVLCGFAFKRLPVSRITVIGFALLGSVAYLTFIYNLTKVNADLEFSIDFVYLLRRSYPGTGLYGLLALSIAAAIIPVIGFQRISFTPPLSSGEATTRSSRGTSALAVTAFLWCIFCGVIECVVILNKESSDTKFRHFTFIAELKRPLRSVGDVEANLTFILERAFSREEAVVSFCSSSERNRATFWVELKAPIATGDAHNLVESIRLSVQRDLPSDLLIFTYPPLVRSQHIVLLRVKDTASDALGPRTWDRTQFLTDKLLKVRGVSRMISSPPPDKWRLELSGEKMRQAKVFGSEIASKLEVLYRTPITLRDLMNTVVGQSGEMLSDIAFLRNSTNWHALGPAANSVDENATRDLENESETIVGIVLKTGARSRDVIVDIEALLKSHDLDRFNDVEWTLNASLPEDFKVVRGSTYQRQSVAFGGGLRRFAETVEKELPPNLVLRRSSDDESSGLLTVEPLATAAAVLKYFDVEVRQRLVSELISRHSEFQINECPINSVNISLEVAPKHLALADLTDLKIALSLCRRDLFIGANSDTVEKELLLTVGDDELNVERFPLKSNNEAEVGMYPWIPLSLVCEITQSTQIRELYRDNGQRAVVIGIDSANGDTYQFQVAVRQLMERCRNVLPAGCTIELAP